MPKEGFSADIARFREDAFIQESLQRLVIASNKLTSFFDDTDSEALSEPEAAKLGASWLASRWATDTLLKKMLEREIATVTDKRFKDKLTQDLSRISEGNQAMRQALQLAEAGRYLETRNLLNGWALYYMTADDGNQLDDQKIAKNLTEITFRMPEFSEAFTFPSPEELIRITQGTSD